MIQAKYLIPLGVFGAGVAVGLGVGWKLWITHTAPAIPQAAIRLPKGGQILPVVPSTAKDAERAIPIEGLPKGAKVELRAQAKLLPHLATIPTGGQGIHGPGGNELLNTNPISSSLVVHPITVNLALVKMPDGHERVAMSSPDADVVGGMDLPITEEHTVKDLKWLAGASYNPSDRTYGAFVMRGIGPVVVGVEVNQVKAPIIAGGGTTLDGRITLGIRF